MKTIIISLILMVAGVSAQAQSPSDLFQQFKSKPHAEYVHFGRLLFSILKPIVNYHADDPAGHQVMHCVQSLRTLDLVDCTPEVRKQFTQMANGLQAHGFHEVVSSCGEGERTRVLVRQKGQTIRELLLLSTGDECSLVQIKCKVKPEDLATIVNVMK